MSNYTIQRTNLRNAETNDVIAGAKRDSLLRRIRDDVLNQPQWLQDYDRELTELSRLFGVACRENKLEAMKDYNRTLLNLGDEYIQKWEEWQDDLAYLQDKRNDCTCHDGSCAFCKVSAKVKR